MIEPQTWDGFTLLAPYGYVQPNGIDGHPDTERGDVYAGPIGAPVELPATAYYDAADSTRYQSVFRTPSGQGINVMHIDALPFADGAQVNAGTIIGDITAHTGTYYDRGHTYFSQFPDAHHGVVEVGLYDNPQDASNRNSGYTDPAAMLAQGPASGRGSSDPFAGWPIDPTQWGSNPPSYWNPFDPNNLNLGGHSPTDIGAQAERAAVPALINSTVGKQAVTYGVIALLAVAALAVFLLVIGPMVAGKV